MYQEIPLKQITPNPHNSRTTFTGVDFDEVIPQFSFTPVLGQAV